MDLVEAGSVIIDAAFGIFFASVDLECGSNGFFSFFNDPELPFLPACSRLEAVSLIRSLILTKPWGTIPRPIVAGVEGSPLFAPSHLVTGPPPHEEGGGVLEANSNRIALASRPNSGVFVAEGIQSSLAMG